MAAKRKSDELSSARDRKKQRIAENRTIAVQQPSGPAIVHFPSNSTGTNAVAGPSKSVAFVGMQGLPSAIDVEKFAEARAFEIGAMQEAMDNVSGGSGQRVWQTLPRHLRRRAASHDVRRVPFRLRERARAEMDIVRKKATGRFKPKRGKCNRISRTDALLKRQREKTWLETHIWHAKRMKMRDMWGYRLAIHPTEKSFRPSHRASIHGSILHDASYHSLIELKGPENMLKNVLDACCDAQGPGPGAKRFLTGSRTQETQFYKPHSYPFDLVGPITVMWKPTVALNAPQLSKKTPAPAPGSDPTHKAKRKGKQAQPQTESSSTEEVANPPIRTVWIRTHPAVFDDVFSGLQHSASLVLQNLPTPPGTAAAPSTEIEIADLRENVNVFEIMGPKSNQVLKGALTPIKEDKREDFKKFWSSLPDLQTSGSLPRGMVIGFEVYDPRLNFPPKNAKYHTAASASSAMTTFPTSALAHSDIWDESTRKSLTKPRFAKKDLDARRAQNLIPGTKLNAQRQDDRVPVLLIQRTLENASQTPNSQSIHGWTLIIPSGWAMPFLSSLIYTGTRVGGLRERQTQAFEAGTTSFPRDIPFTSTYESFVIEREQEERDQWERKPPAKRANFDKLGTRSPWKPDWEVVLGIEPSEPVGLVTTQREPASTSTSGEGVRPWLLRGVDVIRILDEAASLFNHGSGLLAEINKFRQKRSMDPLGVTVRSDDLWRGALISVSITMRGRGAPDDLAAIYCLSDDEAKQWHAVFDTKRTAAFAVGEDRPDEVVLSGTRHSPETIIGYVTRGNFSLSRGEGFSIGAVSVSRFFDLKAQAQRLGHPNLLSVIVRNRDDDTCRAALLEVMVG
ncbi:POP1-domain-containing protein [Athelia psychrophila]|uniref:POP1-domain-containing protein n=1 Tax=Athelia psychrophila TaxID=1759441 RepID=A0A166WB28_9AGAM|nr:POP1-domain-containing protein [Fibularhizoctonia sp. CBS 109695]